MTQNVPSQKELGDCVTFKEKLYFCLKNIYQLKGIPTTLAKEDYFEGLFHQSALARLTAQEQIEYNEAMTTERDIRNQISYAYKEGKDEGILIGENMGIQKSQARIAKSMKEDGLPVEKIVKYSGLTPEQIAAL